VVRRLSLAAVALVAAGVFASAPHAEAYVRVITQRAPVHTGPGSSYRTLDVTTRGDVLPVRARATEGYWFKVALEDGTTGWIYGELVFPFEVVADTDAGVLTRAWRATRRALFAPSPVPRSDVEISFSAGVLDGEGAFLLRPAYLVDDTFSLEAFAGLSPRKQDDLFVYGAGWTFRLLPGSTLGPHVFAGVGGASIRPKGDNPVGDARSVFALSVGGGLELTFKKQITVRIDVRNWTFFDANTAGNGQEYSSGLAIFF